MAMPKTPKGPFQTDIAASLPGADAVPDPAALMATASTSAIGAATAPEMEPVMTEAAPAATQAEAVADAALSMSESLADAAETVGADGPSRPSSRFDGMFDVPRLMGGFLQRQARRSVEGAMGLSRCRSVTEAVELQGTLVRESVGDFVEANAEIAARTLMLAGRMRPPFVGPRP